MTSSPHWFAGLPEDRQPSGIAASDPRAELLRKFAKALAPLHAELYRLAGDNDRMRELVGAVVEAWTHWIDTRPDEWAEGPDDPVEQALDDAIGALGRVAVPERYDG